MKTHPPRHPVVIIGAGIAGLTAAHALQDMDIPHLVLERFGVPGGRLNSRIGQEWIVDQGTQFIQQGDTIILDLIRKVGMEDSRVSIQGGVLTLRADGTIVTPHGAGTDMRRLCIDTGFRTLTNQLAAAVNVRYGAPVSAIRWDNDEKVFWWQKEGQVFWFEDSEGEPLLDPVSQKIVVASGVILATTPTVATAIAKSSGSLAAVAPILEGVRMSSTFVGIFKVPHQPGHFYGLQGEPGSRIAWLSFEDRKAPERIDTDYSLLLVHASDEWSAQLLKSDDQVALTDLYNAARAVLPALPESPIEQTFKKWNASRVISEPLRQPLQRGIASGHWPTNPPHVPFALAGDYIHGNRAEDAARAGLEAAMLVASQLPRKRRVLGLEIPVS